MGRNITVELMPIDNPEQSVRVTIDLRAPRTTAPLSPLEVPDRTRAGRIVQLIPGQDALSVPTASLRAPGMRLHYGEDMHRIEGHFDDLTPMEQRAYRKAYVRLNGGAIATALRSAMNESIGGVSGWCDAAINVVRETLGLKPLAVRVPYVSPTQRELALRIAVANTFAGRFPGVDFGAVPAIASPVEGYAKLSYLGMASERPMHFHVLACDETHTFEVLTDEQFRKHLGR